MFSRDELLLYPELKKRKDWLFAKFPLRYPNSPTPKISCTYRSPEEQMIEFNEGTSKAMPGQSLHNYKPCYAFDVFFVDSKGVAVWDRVNFKRFGELAESIDLEWGGRWVDLVDGPHIQMPMTWRQARDGVIPVLPPLPPEEVRTRFETFVETDLDGSPRITRKPFVVSIDGKPVITAGSRIDIRYIV